MFGSSATSSDSRPVFHGICAESAEITTMRTAIGVVHIGVEPRRLPHYAGVCDEVIDRDCYGVRTLQEGGFSPQVIVDIGAHIGTFTRMAAHAWPDARIIAVEACGEEDANDPFGTAIARCLRANVGNLPNISVVPKALIGFLDDPDAPVATAQDFGLAMPMFEDRFRSGLRPRERAISVRALLREYAIDHIDFLKIDCEGSEVNILRECAELGLLEKIRRIRGEWHYPFARAEVRRILAPTHAVATCWAGSAIDQWNLFRADLRPNTLTHFGR